MKPYQVIYRFAVGYGANLRYIGMRRTFIVNADSTEEAIDIVSAYNGTTFGTGLYRGWLQTVKRYNGGKTTRTTQDLRELQDSAPYVRRDDVTIVEPLGASKVFITAIYDNCGRSFDRYAAYLNIYESRTDPRVFQCFVMSDNPQHPQGVGMHSYGTLGRHNGKRIRFSDLPAQCQETLNSLEYQEFPR